MREWPIKIDWFEHRDGNTQGMIHYKRLDARKRIGPREIRALKKFVRFLDGIPGFWIRRR